MRARACNDGGAGGCPGNATETVDCLKAACPGFPFWLSRPLCTDSTNISVGAPNWQQWGQWSRCSATCGLGTTVRARSCCDSNLRGNMTCVGNSTEAKDCTSAACQGNPMLH